MLFDWLVTGQVVPMNPAAVRSSQDGKTPVLDGAEWRTLLDSIPAVTLRDLRDRALIATLTYSFARITAALKMKVRLRRDRRGPQGMAVFRTAPGHNAHALTERAMNQYAARLMDPPARGGGRNL
jgi:hypothetical protein